MAWTNTNFYMSMIFVVVVVFSGLAIVGTDLLNDDRISINEDGVDYIAQLKGLNDENGYDTMANTSSAENEGKGILDSSENSTVSDSSDFLSTLYIKKERADEPTNFLKVAYNVPSTLILGLGLPLEDFRWLINILSLALFISIIILVWTRWIRT